MSGLEVYGELMKLDAKLFLPLFREVKQVQDALRTYCLESDATRLPLDNLQYAIEQVYGITIEPNIVPLRSRLLRGLIEKYPGRSVIYIDGALNSAWNRYVFAKEVSHHLLDGEDFHTSDPTAVIEEIVFDESDIDGLDDVALDVQAEILTKFAAIELLFPLDCRKKCKEEIEKGEKTTYDISSYFDIPEHLIEFALSENYTKFSTRIWDQVRN